ncbi:hypothetical protein RFI_32656 [Reticulomyxa filosa]|uniref:CCHC-type domain-containing protein n=1 Tax=Reticulomyxa filosa TaxID=46433 RepID=X6LVI4_RETFI|nr:hypothetical protein RFI_32656 [Reticulomyxa filosa]|eukprot:ETO04740.1 hypothetical protein RFI_32656 [Reticulomyxa filosa]
MLKKNMRTRRQFLCSNVPTIVITPINPKNFDQQHHDNDTKETLENYGYQIQEVKRFHKMTIVKLMLSKTEDVIKILKDNDIQIGYSVVKVGPFDRNKSRPKSHFRQCRNCYKLNHIARECPKKRKACKTTQANINVCYVVQHPSNSVQCEVIRKAREKLSIKLTRKEDAFLKKKAS